MNHRCVSFHAHVEPPLLSVNVNYASYSVSTAGLTLLFSNVGFFVKWQAAWIRVPHLIRSDLEAESLSLREGIHAASHALLNIMPL